MVKKIFLNRLVTFGISGSLFTIKAIYVFYAKSEVNVDFHRSRLNFKFK